MTTKEALKVLKEAVEELEFMYVNHHDAVTNIQHKQDKETIKESLEALKALREGVK